MSLTTRAEPNPYPTHCADHISALQSSSQEGITSKSMQYSPQWTCVLRTSPSISLQLQFASKRHAQALSTLHQILQMLRQKQITPRRQHFCHQWNQHSECRAGPMPESLMAGDGVREMLRHYSLRAVMLLASASPGPWCW